MHVVLGGTGCDLADAYPSFASPTKVYLRIVSEGASRCRLTSGTVGCLFRSGDRMPVAAEELSGWCTGVDLDQLGVPRSRGSSVGPAVIAHLDSMADALGAGATAPAPKDRSVGCPAVSRSRWIRR